MGYGLIDEVVCPLMSGKEAQVYLVIGKGDLMVAKVYKAATERSFKNRADYTEGRRTGSSREDRAIGKRTKHGRAQVELAWRSAEVDAIYRLRAAGVRVPAPHAFVDGVLLMELIADPSGHPAPRLSDVAMGEQAALDLMEQLLCEVVKMLCAGLVHGDLSEYNVLFGADGPAIIDFPQTIDIAHNRSARKLLIRDVDNLTRYLGRFAPKLVGRPYGQEIWELYEQGVLTPGTPLTGIYRPPRRQANVTAVLSDLQEQERDELKRRQGLGAPPSRRRRGGGGRPAPQPQAAAPKPSERPLPDRRPADRPPQHRPPQDRPPQHRPPQQAFAPGLPTANPAPLGDGAPRRSRRRRRGRTGGPPAPNGGGAATGR